MAFPTAMAVSDTAAIYTYSLPRLLFLILYSPLPPDLTHLYARGLQEAQWRREFVM